MGASGRRFDHHFPRHRRHCCCPPARRHQLQAGITKAVNSFFIITIRIISIIVHMAQLDASGRRFDLRFPHHRRHCCFPPARRHQVQAGNTKGVNSSFMHTIRIIRITRITRIIRIIRTRRTRITRITRIIRTHRKRRILRAPSTAHTPSPGRRPPT